MLVFEKDGIEIMIPLQEPIFVGIDKNKKQFNLNIPEGYLEVFMSYPNQKDDEV